MVATKVSLVNMPQAVTRAAAKVGHVMGLIRLPSTIGVCLRRARPQAHTASRTAPRFFHRVRLATVRVKRLAAEISGVTSKIGATEKDRQAIYRDQPDGERFGSDTRLPFFALNGGVYSLNVFLFAIIHSLANTRRGFGNFFVHGTVILPARAMVMVMAPPVRLM